MAKKFYLKERHNGQTGIYFVQLGQLTKKDATKHEKSLSGFNIVHSYETKEEYENVITELKAEGGKFH